MELGTFGAILGFALDLEERAAGFYEAVAQGEREGAFQDLAKGTHKRLERLERARREGVAEMILESITGLSDDAYQVDLAPGAGEVDRLRQAIALEETAARFYRDAAAKMPIKEIVRLFERLAKENDKRRAQLEK
jgi:rubrerythrin